MTQHLSFSRNEFYWQRNPWAENQRGKIKISSKRLAQLFEYPVKSNSGQKLARKDKGDHHILLINKGEISPIIYHSYK